MEVKFLFSKIKAARAGLRELKTGKFICPDGRFCYRTRHGSYFYLANGDTLSIPDRRYELLISAGSNYFPVKQTILPSTSKKIILNITIKPLDNIGDSHWCDADFHIHGPYRDEKFPPAISKDNMPVEIVGENITYSCVVDKNGKAIMYAKDRHLIQAFEYRNGAYGHYLFLGGFRAIERQREQYIPEKPYPLPLKFFNEAKHAGATIICAHPITNCKFYDTSSWPGGGYARGLLLLLSSGLVDAVSITDVSCDRDSCKKMWYHLLNLGFKIPAVAGTDVCLTHENFPPVGTWRTYSLLKDEIKFDYFLANIRRGHSLLSTAPILEININGYEPGDLVDNKVETQTLNIKLKSPSSINNVKIIIDGEIYREFLVDSLCWEHNEHLDRVQRAWLAVECLGNADWYYPHGLWAHTNPIYFMSKPKRTAFLESCHYIESFISKLRKYLEMRGLKDDEMQIALHLSDKCLNGKDS